MLTLHYKTKKELKGSIGRRLKFTETSIHGPEYRNNGTMTGCNHPKRSWYASIKMKDGKIESVK